MIVLAEGWPQEDSFLDKLRKIIAAKPALPAYYPGTEQRYQGFLNAYPEEVNGKYEEGKHEIIRSARGSGPSEYIKDLKRLPPMLVYCAAADSEYALCNEAFGPVLAFTRLPCQTQNGVLNSRQFLIDAARFCNENIWGTLSCTVLAHPSIPEVDAAIDDAVAILNYGSVGINTWTARCFGVEALPWGAAPGEPLNNVQSGIGFVRNAYGVDHPSKGVLRSPFVCSEHLGCDSKPMTIWRASTVCRFVTQGGLGALLNMLCFPGCCCWCKDPSGVSSSDYRNGD